MQSGGAFFLSTACHCELFAPNIAATEPCLATLLARFAAELLETLDVGLARAELVPGELLPAVGVLLPALGVLLVGAMLATPGEALVCSRGGSS